MVCCLYSCSMQWFAVGGYGMNSILSHAYVCDNVINLSIESGKSSDIPASMWNIYTMRSQASVFIRMFTSTPRMSYNISYCETSKLEEYSDR